MDFDSAIENALHCHRAGDLTSAGVIYNAILTADPDQPTILHLAGVLAHQSGDAEKALEMLSRAVALAPTEPEYLVCLGAVQKASGRLAAARESFSKAARFSPRDAEILNELGGVLNALGHYHSAAACFAKAVSLTPESAEIHFNLGLALRNRGDIETAAVSFDRALKIQPDLAEASHALGNLHHEAGRLAEAVACYRRVAALVPDSAEAHYNMGNAAKSAGDTDLAAECYRKAISLKPEFAAAHNNLGLVFKDTGRLQAAVSAYQQALAYDPQLVEAHFNLGIAEQMSGRYESGLHCFARTLQIEPNYAPAKWLMHLSLPIIYEDVGQIARCRERFRTNLENVIRCTPLGSPEQRRAALRGVGSMTNFYLQYQGRNDRELQSRYGEFVCRVMAVNYPQWSRPRSMPPIGAGRRIRIGYVSSFMRAHTVGEFLAGWLENHHREDFEIHCYHIGTQTDAMTPRFRNNADHFHQIGADLEKAAARILADDLHVLVFTDIGMNALATQLAALRLAPVQCKGWGHPVTTGLPTVDYYLSSDLMEPANAREHYSETLIRLPNLALAYSPPVRPGQIKARSDFGLREDAFVCLSSQSLFKYLPQHDDIYPRIALEVPDVRFVFLAHDSPEISRQFTDRLARAFEARHLDAARFCGVLPRQHFPDFLGLNLASDVLLDTFEWSGGKTTLEAISCGLPVVTCPGEMMRGRHACAMLLGMGLTELIAKDKSEYVRIVTRLRRDRAFYAQVRAQIAGNRDRIYNDKSCIRALEDFYRKVSHRCSRMGDGGAGCPPASCDG